jgi:hypothetical protein
MVALKWKYWWPADLCEIFKQESLYCAVDFTLLSRH